MALDRSKFKTTVVANIVEQDKELASSLGRDGGNYAQYIKLEDGDNLLRIYPAHPEEDGGGDAFAEPKVTVFIPMMVPDYDSNRQPLIDKTGRPILKESVRSVFNARIHGNLPKDLIEEYCRISLHNLEEALKVVQDPVEKSKITEKINRIKGNYALKMNGLNYRSAWVMYVDRIVGSSKTFGPIEIGVAVKEGINKTAASTDSGNNPLATDPFTDLDTGRAIIVKYNSKATKPQDYYSVSLDNVTIPEVHAGKTFVVPRMFPLDDDQLESFMKVTPLAKRFKNCFTKRDFDLQMEGLEFFDQKYNIDTFQDMEFINVCEEIQVLVPEPETTEEQAAAAEAGTAPIDTTSAPQTVVKEEEPTGDAFDFMTRAELGAWHKENKSGVLIKPTMTDDDVRNLARQHVIDSNIAPEEASEEEYTDEDAAEEVPTGEPEPQPETTQTTTLDRIAAMKAKAGIGAKK